MYSFVNSETAGTQMAGFYVCVGSITAKGLQKFIPLEI